MTKPSSDAAQTKVPAETKKVYIKTFGCQMNAYDSERMAEAMAAHGYAEHQDPSSADLIVLNTCHIREKAAEKVYSELGRLRTVKEERHRNGKDTVVAVAGCVAQAEGGEILARSKIVDVVVGPQAYHRLPDLVSTALQERRQVIDTEFPEEEKFSRLPERAKTRAAAAFLTVQEGCDKFCTFCVVPYTRGMEFSRPVRLLEEEARRLVGSGVRELTLLGQNVNAYHGEGPDAEVWSLAKLLNHLEKIDGLERLRYTTSHPRDMTEDLIAAHATNSKLMPYLHLPFQAGADRILAAMNRKHTGAEYRALVARIRQARPDIALSTDIIVGFPGETEDEFEQTLQMVREIGFAQAFSFKYSPRPGTPAATIEETVPEAVKSDRLQRLQQLLSSQQASFNTGCVGKVFPVLFEKLGRRSGQLVGRSPYLQPVHADAEPNLLGQILPVEIYGASASSLAGIVR